MCEVSDKIKFCTCRADDTERSNNYWVFYRYNKGQFDGIMGICDPPMLMNGKMVQYNEETLLKRVNEPDAFDIDLKPKSKDRLKIILNCEEHFRGSLNIGFEFKKGKWAPCKYDVFEWTWKHAQDASGKLK